MTLDPRPIAPAVVTGRVTRIESAGTVRPLGGLRIPPPTNATWMRRQLRSRVTVGASLDQLDSALRRFRGRVGYLRHVMSLGVVGERLVVHGRIGVVRREYRAVIDGDTPGRLSWSGPTSDGALEWDSTGDGRSTLTLILSWEPDSLVGLAIATVQFDRRMLRGELRRFAGHVAGSLRR